MSTPTATAGPDGRPRCPWAVTAPDLLAYHDEEWGLPAAEDRQLFEKLCLEGFQAGLSWRTILAKREAFRRAFAEFDLGQVAGFDDSDIERLMGDAGIVRNRAKIEAAISNARRAEDLIEREGSLGAFIWSFEPDLEEVPEPQTLTTSPSAIALSKELKRRGWRFVGPTTTFAFMQSMGLINDHVWQCVRREEIEVARRDFARPVRSVAERATS